MISNQISLKIGRSFLKGSAYHQQTQAIRKGLAEFLPQIQNSNRENRNKP